MVKPHLQTPSRWELKMNKEMNKKLTTKLGKQVILVAAISALSLTATADSYRDYDRDYDYDRDDYQENVSYDYARVINVTPVRETYRVNKPVRKCWNERRRRSDYRYNDYPKRSKSHTGEILGALVGSAVGHQFGKGRGKKVATAAGAVLGASVARDIKNQNRTQYRRGGYDRGYETTQRCEMRDRYTTEERIRGYDVAYKYRGKVYRTEMNERPGREIKVRVSVDPV